jgi:hypothetical protein
MSVSLRVYVCVTSHDCMQRALLECNATAVVVTSACSRAVRKAPTHVRVAAQCTPECHLSRDHPARQPFVSSATPARARRTAMHAAAKCGNNAEVQRIAALSDEADRGVNAVDEARARAHAAVPSAPVRTALPLTAARLHAGGARARAPRRRTRALRNARAARAAQGRREPALAGESASARSDGAGSAAQEPRAPRRRTDSRRWRWPPTWARPRQWSF